MLGALVTAAAAATAVWRIGPPGPLGAILVGGGASALGTTPGEFGPHLLAAAGGVLLSWLLCMLPWLWDPDGQHSAVLVRPAADQLVEQVRGGLTDRVGVAVQGSALDFGPPPF